MNRKQTIRVLIADDETAIRNGLYSAISWEQLNMSVVCSAKDGLEAWEFIREYKPDIAITDIRMPQMSGLELIKRCRDNHLDTMFIIISGYDDFSYAQAAIRYGAKSYVLKPLKTEELMAELENLKSELEQQRAHNPSAPSDYQALQNASKKLFLNQLIHNEFRYESDIISRLKTFPNDLEKSSYRIVVFSLDEEPQSEGPQSKATQAGASCPRQDLTALIVNAGQRILAPYHGEIWISNSSQVILLLHYPQSEEEPVRKALRSCSFQLKKDSGCHISIGIGSREQELVNASRSYEHALNALSYCLYESGQNIYDESIICTSSPALSSGSVDTEPLIDAIRKGNEPLIRDYCRHFFRSLLYVPMPPPSYIRGMSIYLVTDVQNALKKQITEDIDIFTELPYISIRKLATFRQIESWTTGLFIHYGEFLSQYFQDHRDGIIVNAKQYICSHIDQKVPAEEVAAYVNLSVSYFTIYFKAKTGINFRDYVLNVKMKEAKRLLETSPANISEVAYAVGYDDYSSFYRAFKNCTGMTPSAYQASVSEHDDKAN